MLDQKMEQALNDQINAEMYSSYLYLSMSAYFDSVSLSGMAHWMNQQAREEMFHAMKMYNYVNGRGGRVLLRTIDQPPHEWNSTLAVFEHVLEHEQKVTGLINDLTNLALDLRDHATSIFLQWFISEQVEEEASVGEIVDKLKLINGEANGLFMLDSELGKRIFTLPAKGG